MTKSVLVFDNDITCNPITVSLLKEIEVVINGLEAINFLKETPQFPDLILLDINMPIMNRLDFLKTFKSEDLNVYLK